MILKRVPAGATIHQRIMAGIEEINGCWEWQKAINSVGYAVLNLKVDDGYKVHYVHRLSYETFNGPIAEGLVIDHLCRNPRCVNPAHLEQVSMSENIRRGISPLAVQGRSNTCPNGHLYSPENTGEEKGFRRCLTCRAEQMAQRNVRRKEKRLEARIARSQMCGGTYRAAGGC